MKRAPSLATRFYPSLLDSNAVGRGLIAGGSWRAARGVGQNGLAAALRKSARGELSDEEATWVSRIEARRSRLAESGEEISPGFDLQSDETPGWAALFDHRMPLWAPTRFLSIPPLWGRLLFRLVRELRPRSCLELGTGLGISTAYQAAALSLNGGGRIVTLDAATDWSRVAREGLEELGLGDLVEQRLGPIAASLAPALEDARPVELALVDAEHQEKPTLAYLDAMLPHLAPGAVVVFDDIGHPREMRRAWRAVARRGAVGFTVGLGRMGIARIR